MQRNYRNQLKSCQFPLERLLEHKLFSSTKVALLWRTLNSFCRICPVLIVSWKTQALIFAFQILFLSGLYKLYNFNSNTSFCDCVIFPHNFFNRALFVLFLDAEDYKHNISDDTFLFGNFSSWSQTLRRVLQHISERKKIITQNFLFHLFIMLFISKTLTNILKNALFKAEHLLKSMLEFNQFHPTLLTTDAIYPVFMASNNSSKSNWTEKLNLEHISVC